MNTVPLLCLLLWTTVCAAALPKKCPLARVSKPSAAISERATFDNIESLRASEKSLQSLSLQPLTATQQRRREISLKIDSYLYMNDVGPLVTEFDPIVRKVEASFVARKRNLETSEQLSAIARKLVNSESPSKRLTNELSSIVESRVEVSAARHDQLLSASNKNELLASIAGIQKEIADQNLAHEKTIGTHIDEYEQIRGHLDSLIYGDESSLLNVVDRIDSRVSRSISPAMAAPTVAAPDHGSKPESAPKTKDEIVTENLAKLDAHINELGGFRDSLLANPATDLTALRDYIRSHELQNETLLKLLEAPADDKSARDQLLDELKTLSDRLLDSKTIVSDALKLQKKLGLHRSDFAAKYPNYLGNDAARPSLIDIKKLGFENTNVETARLERSVAEQRQALLNSWLLLGKVAETAGAAAQKLSAASHATFGDGKLTDVVDWFFRDLADLQARKHYYPSLLLLHRVKGSADKKLDILRRLNSLTPDDELLVTLARRGDMLETWLQMKEAARSTITSENGTETNRDPLDFHGRMAKAEATAKKLGELSPLDESGYLQHLGIASLKLGTAAGTGWLLTQAGLAAAQGLGGLAGGSPGELPSDEPNDDKKEKEDAAFEELRNDLSAVDAGLNDVALGSSPGPEAAAAAIRLRARATGAK